MNTIDYIFTRRKDNKVQELAKRKIINNLDEIYDGNKLLITDFSNLDLSCLDLSKIPMIKWENCTFFNTNFSGTGIKFIPNKLKQNFDAKSVWDLTNIKYCDFSNNDLSYLDREDFLINYRNQITEISTIGCNFRDTGLNHNCLRYLYDVLLDKSYGQYDFEHWGDFDGNYADFDLMTVIKNPFLNLSSSRLIRTVEHFAGGFNKECMLDYVLVDKKNSYWKWNLNMDAVEQVVEMCEYALNFDKQGHFKKLYNKISKNFTLENKYWFFRISIHDSILKDVDLSGIPISVLRHYYFDGGNTFDNVILDNNIFELIKNFPGEHFYDGGNRNKFKELYLTGIGFGSWKEKDANDRRISSSPITFFTKVYLELSRVCNAKCKFCRNETFEKTHYDLERIAETLENIKQYLNAVVIGGGEPTLRLDDVVYLKSRCDAEHIDWHMFTNGTDKNIIDNDLINQNFKINLSRHAVSENENASIFGVDQSIIMTAKDIERLNLKNTEVTLNATCFKGGLDTPIKILEYIDFARAIGCKKVLIQNLQRNSSLGQLTNSGSDLNIDDQALAEVILFLQSENFKRKKYPIYASGGYVTYIFKDKKDDFSISIQKYLTKEDLATNWPKAIKRAFDLSIDPSGNLYENWHQNYGKIELEK